MWGLLVGGPVGFLSSLLLGSGGWVVGLSLGLLVARVFHSVYDPVRHEVKAVIEALRWLVIQAKQKQAEF